METGPSFRLGRTAVAHLPAKPSIRLLLALAALAACGRASPPPGPDGWIPHPADWTLRVRAVDDAGRPVAGAQVWKWQDHSDLITHQTMARTWPVPWVDIAATGAGTLSASRIGECYPTSHRTGADGVLRLGPFRPPLRYGACLLHPDFETGDLRVEPGKVRPDAQRVVDLGDLKLSPGRTVRGVVRGPDGKPVKDAWVASQASLVEEPAPWAPRPAGPLPDPGSFFNSPGSIRTARTDERGRYLLSGLMSYPHVVAAWDARHPPSHARVDFSPRTGRATADNEHGGDFRLHEGTSISVTAQDREGRPVPDATVDIEVDEGGVIGFHYRGEIPVSRGHTDAAGRVVARALPKGSPFTVWVTGPYGIPWRSDRGVKPGAHIVARFSHGSLRLTFRGDDGAPVTPIRCELEWLDNPVRYSKRAYPSKETRHPKPQGNRLDVSGLACGQWKAYVHAHEYSEETVEFDMTPRGVNREVVLRRRKGVLIGRVVDADSNAPLAGIPVRLRDAPAFVPNVDTQDAVTNGDGSFAFTRTETDGRQCFYVEADSPTYARHEQTVPMGGAQYDMGTIRLVRGAEVHGVVAAGGAPLPAYRVKIVGIVNDTEDAMHFKDNFRFGALAVSDSDGRWKADRLAPGLCRIEAGDAAVTVTLVGGQSVNAGTLEVGK